ncbi:pseudouridylate synthase 3 [Talaromyces stipitatus ATCC 10500]|uniref:Pseudouridylate synthase 3 n=1 Tax=Talaromyces stipitatus (strain ATCC 10500 / CBS 375.48 / QM 6759 / NRRL 1006) TaxID=441959 RepID=B8M6L3_TALSN|nr:pseudouridylate synthase 3 [Talaromyces stipitatus ATCC 10500]EED19475.1 pseudouridylate synthase 3 [Talaromyces stipitatus ATCC 10500]
MSTTQPPSPGPSQGQDYSTWSTSSLVERIMELERQLNAQTNEFGGVPPAKSEAISAATPEFQVAETPSGINTPKKIPREMDHTKYHTRHIALKFAYLGQRYNGFEHANGNITPLPTIEEEIWKALRKTRLIFPTTSSSMELDFNKDDRARPFDLSWDGCQYSKCGRTDRGVSAFGQVIGIRVRSARPKRIVETATATSTTATTATSGETTVQQVDVEASIVDSTEENIGSAPSVEANETEVDDGWDDIRDELPYIQILNGVLPRDIRILAWCPNPPPDFDARFSCRERQYRYFFTQPAFNPVPGELGFLRSAAHHRGIAKKELRDGWLDIEAMREACKQYIGRHDFRNFCRVDTSKQIENFERIIYHASIDLVDPNQHPLGFVGSKEFQPTRNLVDLDNEGNVNEERPSTPLVYTFTLHGSAFLWHQVRHMVAILFLVGQGVEDPSIVSELLDVSKHPRKPTYEMASDAPLVLWDCVFPDEASGSREDALNWVYCGDPRQGNPSSGKGDGKFGFGGLMDTLWQAWRQRKMDEILAGSLLDLAASQGSPSFIQNELPKKPFKSQKIFFGGDEGKLGGVYVPVMSKRRTETVEVQNARYLASRERRAERLKLEGREKSPNIQV